LQHTQIIQSQII